MKLKKVLWAYDGSEESEYALKNIVPIAKIFNSEIVGVYVIETPIYFIFLKNNPDFQKLMNNAIEDNKKRFSAILTRLAEHKIFCQAKILQGPPSDKILELSHQEKIDLIVIGAKGYGILDRVLIGSTTIKVLRNSEIPVLTVKKNEKKNEIKIKNILVPLDVFEKTDSSVIYALDLSEKLNAKITLLYIVASGIFSYSFPQAALDETTSYANKKFEEMIENIKAKEIIPNNYLNKIEIKTETSYGINPGVTIAEYATKNNIDLIIIHKHKIKPIENLLIGNTAELIIRKAHCPVLALKPRT